MGRRSILDEGEQEDSANETDDSSGSEASERIQTTLRLPSDLADDLDDWADMRGMSRNAAVTYFIAEGLGSD